MRVSLGSYSVVGGATRYGLDVRGIEPRLGSRFSAPIQTGFEAQAASRTMSVQSLSWG
jgi:hypothetical protein